MTGDARYTWRCPLCNACSLGKFLNDFKARRYGRQHIKKQHDQGDGKTAEPIIEKVTLKEKERKQIGETPSDAVWVEVSRIPDGTSPTDKLLIKYHKFIKRKAFEKMDKRKNSGG